MNKSLKGKQESLTPEQLQVLVLMQRMRDAWLEQRAKRVRVIQSLHC